jgi:hypothetical protein
VAELFPLPLTRTASAPEPADPLTPARHQLRQTIARCDRARREAEDAATAVGRLNDIVIEYDQLSADLRELCARDERQHGEWIAAGRLGLPPSEGRDRQLVACRLAGLVEELAAARRTLPSKEEAHRDAILTLQAVQTERAAAVAAVAIEVCEAEGHELTAAINRVLGIEARLLSLRNALNAKGNAGDAEAGHAAEKITAMITATKRGAGVPHDATSGQALIEALATDPEAKLT